MEFPTAKAIVKDVEGRIEILGKLLKSGQPLSDDDWGRIVYYREPLNIEQREQFIAVVNDIRSGTATIIVTEEMPPHSRWLIAVYTGQVLKEDWCRGGSRHHRLVLDRLGDRYRQPSRILADIPNLVTELDLLADRVPYLKRQVIDNIAVDETFEQMGRAMV